MKITEKVYTDSENTDLTTASHSMAKKRIIVIQPNIAVSAAQTAKIIDGSHPRSFHHLAEVIHAVVLLVSVVTTFGMLASRSDSGEDDEAGEADTTQRGEPTVEPVSSPSADDQNNGTQLLLSGGNESELPTQSLQFPSNESLGHPQIPTEHGNADYAGYIPLLCGNQDSGMNKPGIEKTSSSFARQLSDVSESSSSVATPIISAPSSSSIAIQPSSGSVTHLTLACTDNSVSNSHLSIHSISVNDPQDRTKSVCIMAPEIKVRLTNTQNILSTAAIYHLANPWHDSDIPARKMSRQEKRQYQQCCGVLARSIATLTGVTSGIFQTPAGQSHLNYCFYAENKLINWKTISTFISTSSHSQQIPIESNTLSHARKLTDETPTISPMLTSGLPSPGNEKLSDVQVEIMENKSPAEIASPQRPKDEATKLMLSIPQHTHSDSNSAATKKPTDLNLRELLQQKMIVLLRHESFLDSDHEKKDPQNPFSIKLYLVVITMSLFIAFFH